MVLGSYAFSFYVNEFATYEKTYGSLGAVAVLLVWLWLAAYSILMGAELNSEISKLTAEGYPANGGRTSPRA